jgi:acetylornithine deacetylase/succinyl-diaminopimelate desuccinylase-like protein
VLLGTWFVTGLAGCASWSRPAYPDPRQDLPGAAAAILADSIRLQTVNPPGNEEPLAAYLAGVLRNEGIEARVIETPPGESKVGRAAVWARVKGTGRGRPIVLLSHLDVVPADNAEWAVAPFEGVSGGGYVVGRGALDAKGVAVVHLLTLVEIARREQPLDRDVIFLATPDEETGGQDGAGWFVREHPELLSNAEYLLTEGGSVLLPNGNLPPVWGISIVEKTPCWIRITARGTPGHSSAEPRDAAVPRLLDALSRVRELDTEVRVVPEVATMFANLAPYAAPEDRAGFKSLANSLESDTAFRNRFLSDRGQNALVRNTVTITVLQGAPKTNVLPAEAFAHLDARLLPGERCEDFADEVRAAIEDPGVSVEPLLAFAAKSSPVDTDLFRAIREVAAETDPGSVVSPRVIAGFTDAHYFRDVGIVSYGFVPRWLPPSESHGIHGPNERISVQNLDRGVRTMVRILEQLAGSK